MSFAVDEILREKGAVLISPVFPLQPLFHRFRHLLMCAMILTAHFHVFGL